ncbi:Ribosome-binding protein 1 [Merluccius polli]|uniref:Ribosome-binding protein 1 n=1 Tax=Merluccius polli TaxID=89951 RepID=A0AA47N468_MERPO|nr:Ribosome-binding protein 1 [Merluccius polli]
MKTLTMRGDPERGHPEAGHPEAGHPERGHPERGHPERGHPERGHPERGHPERGHPERGHPERGHPEAGDSERGHPERGHPERGHPERGHPERGHPERGHPERGHPERGHPERGYPERGHPERGHPERGHPERGTSGEGTPGEGTPGEGIPGEGDTRRGDTRRGDTRRGDTRRGGHPERGYPERGHPERGHPERVQPAFEPSSGAGSQAERLLPSPVQKPSGVAAGRQQRLRGGGETEAQSEVQRLCDGYAWLTDVRSCADRCGGVSSLEALRGGAVSAYEELVGEVRRWSDRIRRAPPSFATANRLFLVDAGVVLDKLGEQLGAIEAELLSQLVEEWRLNSESLESHLRNTITGLQRDPADLQHFTRYATMMSACSAPIALLAVPGSALISPLGFGEFFTAL